MFTHRALTAALTGQPLRLYGDGHQRRDFTYVDAAVSATIAAATFPTAQGVINVGGGSGASLLEVISIARSLTGLEVQVQQERPRSGDVLTTRANRGRAQEVLEWKPQVDLRNGMHAHMQALASELHAAEPRSHGLRSLGDSAAPTTRVDLRCPSSSMAYVFPTPGAAPR